PPMSRRRLVSGDRTGFAVKGEAMPRATDLNSGTADCRETKKVRKVLRITVIEAVAANLNLLERSPAAARRRADAERKRKQRARERGGVKRLRVEARYFKLIEALLASERITDQDALDQSKVEAALAEVVSEWVFHWTEK